MFLKINNSWLLYINSLLNHRIIILGVTLTEEYKVTDVHFTDVANTVQDPVHLTKQLINTEVLELDVHTI